MNKRKSDDPLKVETDEIVKLDDSASGDFKSLVNRRLQKHASLMKKLA